MRKQESPRHGDIVKFEYDGETAEGTYLRVKFLWGEPKAEIQSGSRSVWVPYQDVICVVQRKEDRGDAPLLAERLRLSGGIE